jgi:hypothetical protein
MAVKLACSLLRNPSEMVAVGRVLLWTVVLVAPGGFLLAPVLVATSLPANGGASFKEQLRAAFGRLQRYWTKS